MNRSDPIPGWRAQPVQLPTGSAKGWTVVFAMTRAGTIPALDYAQGTDRASEQRRPFRERQVGTLSGLVELIRFEGPRALRAGKQFKAFQYPDAPMCELRLGREDGHRFLCFQQDGQRFVIACGFHKQQPDTPPEQKARARDILDQQKWRETQGGRKHGR